MNVSIARIYYPVTVLGHGKRIGIWTTGCHKNCNECISPELRFYDKSKEISVDNIMSVITSVSGCIDGFTISGGEPFYNALALRELVENLININDDIIIFTGYTLSELTAMNSETVNFIMSACSLLITGPYIKELNDNKGLRGSSNQEFLVNRYIDRYKDIECCERIMQPILYSGNILNIGIPFRDNNNEKS